MRNQKCIRKTISEDTGIKSFLDMMQLEHKRLAADGHR